MRSLTFVFIWLFAAVSAHADYRAAAAYSAQHDGVTFVALDDGRVVHEDYPNGGSAETLYPLASGSKSFWGVVAAALVQDGKLNLDERMSATFSEWAADGRRAITVRHVLSLTSGLDSPRTRGNVPTFAAAIGTPLAAEPGSVFAYSGVPFQVFGAFVQRKLGEDPTAYLQRRLLDPIGVAAEWRRPGGDAQTAGGARMRARDWANFGEFVRLGGVWNGKALVDAEALRANFMGSKANPGYGLTWWLKPDADEDVSGIRQFRRGTDIAGAKDVPSDLIMAAGAGKQRLYIVPSRKLVIVRQAKGLRERGGFSDVAFWQALRQ